MRLLYSPPPANRLGSETSSVVTRSPSSPAASMAMLLPCYAEQREALQAQVAEELLQN
ncbi:Uncharacterised protein [Klebsiella pneumoniae]|uniref:Uncharacterized protein n=1 Tax=Klebsiella pneumoniae TaxID=573 RepID=A0A378F5E2_KLEPN|nr:Uncharacterised protein [Klebsiella pneumoniae]